MNTRTPQLRFKEFTDEWQEKMLGNFIVVSMGQSPDSKAYNDNGDGLYLIQGNADIIGRRTKPRFWTKLITKTCEIGDIILTVRAPSGYVAVSKHHACIGRGVCAIKSKGSSNQNFIYQFLLRFEPMWINIEQGSTFKAISGDDIKSLLVRIPSKPEQQKIADFLGAVDEKIGKLEEKKQTFEKYKKGIMQAIFRQKIRFKKPDGSNFPDWEEKKLGEICIISTAPYIDVNNNKTDGYFLIDMGSVLSSGKLSASKHTSSTNNILKQGELVMPNRDIGHGDIIGKVAEINESNRYVLGNNMFCLNTNEGFSPRYIFYAINSEPINREMRKKSNGTSQLQLIRKDVDSQRIPAPAINEQQKIAEFLTGLDNKINLIDNQLEQTKLFKKSLLQRMFV